MAKKKSKISKAEELLKARESDKLKMMREYARLQKLRSTVGGSETKPKVTLPRTGTGRISPLGRMRLRFSIHTGTSCTSGRFLARWKRPGLKGCGSGVFWRPPSGKRMREWRCPMASTISTDGRLRTSLRKSTGLMCGYAFGAVARMDGRLASVAADDDINGDRVSGCR